MDKLTLEHYSEEVKVSVSELTGTSRIPSIALARQTYWYYLQQNGVILKDIANLFHRRSHSTIISGINTIKDMIDTKNNSIESYLQAIGYPFDTFSHQDISN